MRTKQDANPATNNQKNTRRITRQEGQHLPGLLISILLGNKYTNMHVHIHEPWPGRVGSEESGAEMRELSFAKNMSVPSTFCFRENNEHVNPNQARTRILQWSLLKDTGENT